jgi:AraC-like protein
MAGCPVGGPVDPHWQGRQLSGIVGVWRHDATPLRVVRAAAAPPAGSGLSFVVPGSDGATLWQARRLTLLSAGDLVLVDLDAAYDYRSRPGALSAVQVDARALGLTAGQAGAVAPLLRTSALHDLARDHVQALAAAVVSLADVPVLDDLGAATVGLLSALLLSCAPDAAPR